MYGIHEQCVKYGTEPDGYINYVKGANIAGFMKVAHAMMAQGIVKRHSISIKISRLVVFVFCIVACAARL